jgi:hypothetical protein
MISLSILSSLILLSGISAGSDMDVSTQTRDHRNLSADCGFEVRGASQSETECNFVRNEYYSSYK